ncbi:MAG TPA: alcohol dehydrogenase catalytic domain-containing protein, partial [Polyangiales bacterium]
MSTPGDRETMRAAVLLGPGEIEVRSVAIPSPAPSQVRLRLEGCGVCGSNLALWQGRPWFKYPTESGTPGHEGWGVIDRVGDAVDRAWIGRRVAALSYHAFAEYDVAEASHVVPLPD